MPVAPEWVPAVVPLDSTLHAPDKYPLEADAMKASLALILTFLLIGLAGCSDDPAPTAVANFDEVGPPAESGIVTRDGFPVAYTWVDFDTGLRVIVGADMDEFCAGLNNFDIIPYQDVNLADARVITLGKGDIQTTVWDFLDFDCALFTTSEPVAYGRSKFMEVDNDLLGIGEEDNHTNTWGLSARGQLASADGGTVRLNAFIRQQFGNQGGYRVVRKVQLN